MPVPPRLYLWMLDGAAPRLAGEILSLQNGDVSLRYGAVWIGSGYPLSADLPLGPNEYRPHHRRERQSAAPGALDDARPDAWGEKVIRALHRASGRRLFDLLYLAGDERFGAFGISASDVAYTPFSAGPLPRLKDAQRLSDAARSIGAGRLLTGPQQALAAAAASLGGAKPKALIRIGNTQWVLKLFNAEPVDLPLIEHASMTLAAKAGIQVAATRKLRLAGEHALAVRRFDRVADDADGAHSAGQRSAVRARQVPAERRLHCVSAATVLRAETPAGETPRYGYAQLARALRRHADPRSIDAQLRDLFRRMIFNILIANTDDHEKNHALIVRVNGRQTTLELAPAYDIVPTGSGATAHEFLIGEESHEPSLSGAIGVCAHFGLTPRAAAGAVAAVIAVVNTWPQHFRTRGVSARDISELRAVIDREDLWHMRTSFNPRHHAGKVAAAQPARRRRNPFL